MTTKKENDKPTRPSRSADSGARKFDGKKREFKRDNNREKEQPKDEFESKLLDLARVTKVTGGGKNMKFRAVMVVGDLSKGRVS